MTKQEAINKIAELQRFVEDIDAPKFEAGDVFSTGHGCRVSILPVTYSFRGEKRYQFGGSDCNLLQPHSDGYSNGGMTRKEILDILEIRKWKKVGKLGFKPS